MPSRPSTQIDLEKAQTLLASGMTQRAVATELGVDYRLLNTHLKKYGQPTVEVSGVLQTTEPLPFHPQAKLFEMMTGKAYQNLVEDIRLHGQTEPGWVVDGQLLDGRNRHNACMTLGVPFNYRLYQGTDVLTFIVSLNLQRRHLDTSQRAMIGISLADMRQGERTDLTENSVRTSQGEAAAQVHVSVDSLQFAKTVQDQGTPELQTAVSEGKVSVSAAAEMAKEPPETQRALVKKAQSGRQKRVRPSSPSRPRLTKNETLAHQWCRDSTIAWAKLCKELDPSDKETLASLYLPHLDPLEKQSWGVVTSTFIQALTAFQVHLLEDTPRRQGEDDTNTPEEVNHGHQK